MFTHTQTHKRSVHRLGRLKLFQINASPALCGFQQLDVFLFFFFILKTFFGPELERLSEICFYLKSADGISPVWILVLPWFSIRQTLGIHIQIEDGIVFWVVDLGLEQFHDVEESLKRSTEVNDCQRRRRRFLHCKISIFMVFTPYHFCSQV